MSILHISHFLSFAHDTQMWRQAIRSKRESYERKLGADLGPLIEALCLRLAADGECLGTKGLTKKRVMSFVKDIVMSSQEAIDLLATAATSLSTEEEKSAVPASSGGSSALPDDILVEDVSVCLIELLQ